MPYTELPLKLLQSKGIMRRRFVLETSRRASSFLLSRMLWEPLQRRLVNGSVDTFAAVLKVHSGEEVLALRMAFLLLKPSSIESIVH